MSKKILIIDDNGHNGYLLGHFSLELAQGWDVAWLRVTTGNPQSLDELSPKISYGVIDNQEDTADVIKHYAGDDFIVFYDVQLSGVQEDTDEARTSLISNTLRELMADPQRRMLVNVHSADKNSYLVALALDPSGKRVRFQDTVTRQPAEMVRDVVAGTIQTWNSLYLKKSFDVEAFISAMEMMTHEQIQDYASFIKTRIGAEHLTEDQSRQKYPDPADVLMRYLSMDAAEFEKNFCNTTKTLKGEVIEALKTISGVYSLESKANSGRPLSWAGAWLLALGVFRELEPRDKWSDIFNVADLRGEDEGDGQFKKWPSMHAMQSPQRRRETLRFFAKMTRVLFTKKGSPTESVLEKVQLTSGKPPNKLSFTLSFPCIGSEDDQSESLLGRVVGHVDVALAIAEGIPVPLSPEERDTSRAIWRFFLSSSICDLKHGASKRRFGITGGFTPMNILSVENNTKTEVLWRT